MRRSLLVFLSIPCLVAMCFAAGALSIAAFEIVKMSRLWKHKGQDGARTAA